MSKLEEKFLQAIREAGLPEPLREYVFHEPQDGEKQRKWRFDFCYVYPRIAIEIEGGVYNRGRHTRAQGFQADCEKYNTAVEQGWEVYRFTTGMEKDCVALLQRRRLQTTLS